MKYLPYVCYPPLAFTSFVLSVLSWILSPFLALYSVVKNVSTLPGVWQWFSTADDTLDGGINQNEYPNYLHCGRWWVWFYRTRWICRNPAQGFSYHLFRTRGIQLPLKFAYDFGDSNIRGITSGYYCTAKDIKGQQFFALRGVLWPCKYVGLRYNFGWKLTRKDDYHILVFSLALRFNI